MFSKETLIFPSGGRNNYRLPSILATNDGTFIAMCADRIDSLSDHAEEKTLTVCTKSANGDWSEVRTLLELEGWSCGLCGGVYDEEEDTVFIFGERMAGTKAEFKSFTPEELAAKRKAAEEKAAALGIKQGYVILMSKDSGKTFTESPVVIGTVEHLHIDGKTYNVRGRVSSGSHGIQLRHGEHKGRLLIPTRCRIGDYTDWIGIRECTYNNSAYSDDHGKTWQSSDCVQVGTGEGTLYENADGSITYNSRAYFADQKRYLATSTNGGETYGDFRTDDFLIEEKKMGCQASVVRVELDDIKDKSILPEGAEDVTVFCNPRSEIRANMSACVSFDSGKTWSKVKVIDEGKNAYSGLVWNKVTQTFVLLYEKGTTNCYSDGVAALEFDLEWLMV